MTLRTPIGKHFSDRMHALFIARTAFTPAEDLYFPVARLAHSLRHALTLLRFHSAVV